MHIRIICSYLCIAVTTENSDRTIRYILHSPDNVTFHSCYRGFFFLNYCYDYQIVIRNVNNFGYIFIVFTKYTYICSVKKVRIIIQIMEHPIFKTGDKVICLADYRSNEEIRLRAKDNEVYLPKKNQPLTINNIILCATDNCCYLQFEEIDNPLVNGQPVCFYQLNFALSESIEKSMTFSEEVITDMKTAINKGIHALIQKQNNIGSLKMSEAIPFLGMIAIDYKLDLRKKGFKIAKTIFKRSVQFN